MFGTLPPSSWGLGKLPQGAPTLQNAVSAFGLYDEWMLNEGAGPTIRGLRGTVGTLNSGVSWQEGPRGKVLRFDGSTGKCELPYALGTQVKVTFGGFILPTSGQYGVLLDARTTLAGQGFLLYCDHVSSHASFFSNSPLSGSLDCYGTTNVFDGKWHYLVGTCDGSNTRIYVDGNLENTVNVSGINFVNVPLLARMSEDYTGNIYPCVADRPFIYSRVLDLTEIRKIGRGFFRGVAAPTFQRWWVIGTGSAVYENSLSIDGVAAARANQTHNTTLSVDGLGAVATSGGLLLQNSEAISSVGGVALLPGTGYFAVDSIDGLAGITEAVKYGVGGVATAAGTAAFSTDVALGFYQTVAGVSTAAATGSLTAIGLVSIAGITDLESPGGVVYFIQRSVEGFAATGVVPGIGYFNTLSIDGGAAADTDEIRYQNDTLSIDGVADLEVAHLYLADVLQAIAGTSACTITQNLSSVNSVTIGTQTSVHTENVYNILYDTNGVADITIAINVQKINAEQPSAQGSFSATCAAVFRRIVTDTLVFTQSTLYKQPTGLVGDTFVMTQSVFVQAIHPNTVTQTITFTQDAEACRPGASTLVLSQSAVCVKVRYLTVSQTLSMTQAALRSTVLARSVSQTLAFNIVRQVAAPIIGSSGGGNQTQFQYNQPIVNVAIRPRTCLVILGTPTQTIILPCPLFGDTQAYTGQMNLKKTMTGDTYTYVKRTATETVKYSFNLGTYKAIELRNFLLGHSQELITMHNWKGETWYVFLTNNPFEFVHSARWQPSGERVDITLEFEGIRR